jgi:signal transduction histidine kinase
VTEAAGTAVVSTLLRALAVLRFVVLANTVVLYVQNDDRYPHPAAGGWILGALGIWTVVAVKAYDDPRRRRWPLLLTDLAVAAGAIAITPYVKGSDFTATLPGFWVMGRMLALAACWKVRGGLLGALVVSGADIGTRGEFDQSRWRDVFLLLLGGVVVGFVSGLLERMADERDRAEREAAAAAERQRLGRVVHDGVLQVLALVQRRGAEIGGETAELGRLAGEQEVALRAYVQSSVPTTTALDPAVRIDLGSALSALATPSVSVAVPGTVVEVGAHAGAEITAAVAACLSNVRHHVGPQAPAWVLLEDLGDRLVVSVRDQGPGIPAGRLEQAAAEGRMGVAGSIRGRIESLGGVAVLASLPSGTEWELTIPREPS